MPKIETYMAPVKGLEPSNRGIEAEQMAGRRIGAFYHQLGETTGRAINAVGDTLDQQYASTVSNNYSQVFANMSQSWNDTAKNADPNDPDTAEKWRQQVLEPELEKFGSDAPTARSSEYANRLRNDLRNHFFDTTVADQSRLAGVAVQHNLDTAYDNFSTAAANDPSMTTAAIRGMNTIIEQQIATHGMTADEAAKARGDLFQYQKGIAIAGFKSAATTNPRAAQQMLDSGQLDNYISGDEKDTLSKYAQTQQHMQEEQTRSDAAEQRRQNEDANKAAASKLIGTMVQPDGSLAVPKNYFQTVAELAAQPDADPGLVRSMIDMGKTITKEQAEGKPAITDPHTYEDFRNRLSLPSADPRALTDRDVIEARADGKLSDKDYTFWKGAVEQMNKDPGYRAAQSQLKDFLRGMKSSVTRSNVLMGTPDPAGDQRFLQFEQRATAEFEQTYRTNGDWRGLLDRSGKNSLWQQAVPYMTDQKGALHDLMQQSTGAPGLAPAVGAPKRNPGESAAAFLARTGG